MQDNRVVITGVGVIAPNGIGKDEFWQSIENGRSGIKRISRFDTSDFPVQIAGEVDGFDVTKYIDSKSARRMDRTSHLAVAAAKMAVEDAGINLQKEDRRRIGVMVGSCLAGHGFILEQHNTFLNKGPMRINPFTAIASFPDATASHISIELGLNGPSLSIATACSSASDAIGYAFNAVRKRELDIIIMGGAEAPIFAPILAAFCMLRALSTRNDCPQKASRPFDRLRDGFVLGEGAGILILEELRHAQERSANIYGEIIGSGMTCDAYDMVRPEPDGLQAVRAIRLALDDARIGIEDIDYISAHGTSTLLNDRNETKIIKNVFKEQAYKIPVSSVKSMIGHLIGAAGSVELIAGLLAMKHNIFPPTINYENPDTECDLDYVPNRSRKTDRLDVILKNSFGFGGKNSALIIRKYYKDS